MTAILPNNFSAGSPPLPYSSAITGSCWIACVQPFILKYSMEIEYAQGMVGFITHVIGLFHCWLVCFGHTRDMEKFVG